MPVTIADVLQRVDLYTKSVGETPLIQVLYKTEFLQVFIKTC